MKIKLVKYITILSLGMFFAGCVQTVENPYSGGGPAPTDKPVINVLSPVNGDSIYMGYTQISYQATDFEGGPGLDSYNLFIDGILIQNFKQNKDGTNPILYFHTDTLEKKLEINPANWPSEISYAISVINKNGNFGTDPEKDSVFTVFVNRKPEAPSDLIITRISDKSKSFNLFWDDLASNESKYELWRQDGINNAFVRIKELAANTISTNDVVNSDYINYGYKVRAVNGFGNSDFSNIVYSSGVPGGDAPTNLKGEVLGASTVQLTWDDNSDTEDGFILERTNPATEKFERLVVLPRNTKEYFDTDLSPLTTYRYKVASFKSSSVSPYSNIVTVSTYSDDVPAPSNLIATYQPLKKAVVINWNDNTFLETGTIVERKETINGEFIVIGNTSSDVNTYYDSLIVKNQLYYYRARFTTTEGFKTKYSNVDTAFVYDAPPIVPTNLKITKFSDTTYSLWWNDNSTDEEGFELWRKAGNTGNYVLHKELHPNTTAFNDVVVAGVVYYYKVRAFRSPTFSNFSNEVTTEDGSGGKFPAPTKLNYQIVNGSDVKLSWTNKATDELQIIVERKLQSETEFTQVKILPPGTTTWTDDYGLSKNLTLYYRLKAKYSQGESDYSNELMVYIP